MEKYQALILQAVDTILKLLGSRITTCQDSFNRTRSGRTCNSSQSRASQNSRVENRESQDSRVDQGGSQDSRVDNRESHDSWADQGGAQDSRVDNRESQD